MSDQSTFPGVARVILTAKQALVGEYVTVLQRLVVILRKVAPNPSNPNFDQYIFVSLSGFIRFFGATVPDLITISEFCALPSFHRNPTKGHRSCVVVLILKLLLECRKIHTLCLPDPRPDAHAAPRGASRLPRLTSAPSHTSHLGSKGFYPRPRCTAACLPHARRRGDGRGKPAHVGAGHRAAETHAEQGE